MRDEAAEKRQRGRCAPVEEIGSVMLLFADRSTWPVKSEMDVVGLEV